MDMRALLRAMLGLAATVLVPAQAWPWGGGCECTWDVYSRDKHPNHRDPDGQQQRGGDKRPSALQMFPLH
jgi:hypothetical protein